MADYQTMTKTFRIYSRENKTTLTCEVTGSLDDVVDFAIMLKEEYGASCDITYSPPIPFLN